MECCKSMRTEIPKLMEIIKVVSEGKGQKSFFFKDDIDCKPGQFIMVWLPGIDEKPMAISYHKKGEFAFTSQIVGGFTKALDSLRKGDKIGIRGPYGNSFSLKGNACVVAGGVGLSSVSTLIDSLKNPLIIYGTRSKEHLIYLKRYKNSSMIVATDDGSFGKKGFTTDILKGQLEANNNQNNGKKNNHNKKINIVYTCGPEIMMKKVFDLCRGYGVECEASLERMMKCGYGVCGACMCSDKIVCMDGPIFNSNQLKNMQEFGNFARLKTGRKASLKDYHSIHA